MCYVVRYNIIILFRDYSENHQKIIYKRLDVCPLFVIVNRVVLN